MVEKASRSETSASRATTEPQWELFVRETEHEPLCHVGMVAAPSSAVAHEEASKLFAWYARDVWVCPADSVHRFSTETLGADPDSESSESDSVPDQDSRECASNGSEGSSSPEPRVYEETEGTPDVGKGMSNVGGGSVETHEAGERNSDAEIPNGSGGRE